MIVALDHIALAVRDLDAAVDGYRPLLGVEPNWLGGDGGARHAWFQFANQDRRGVKADRVFDGLARPDDERVSGGVMRARGENQRTLAFVALTVAPGSGGPLDAGYYELDQELKLRPVNDPAAHQFSREHSHIPAGVLHVDDASVLFIQKICCGRPNPFTPKDAMVRKGRQ